MTGISYFTNIAFSCPKGIILGEQDFQTFLKVLESGKNGACLKKVQKNTYSAYLNDGARLLFVEDETSLKLIAKFSSHDEYMEKLKQKGLASRYLKDLDRKEFDLVFSNIPHPDYILSSEEHTALLTKIDFTQKLPKGLYCTLEGKNVELNEKQKSLSHGPKPELQKSYTRMLTGGPGTGKTVSLMSEFEEAYGRANQIAAGPETKHSSEEIQQFIYLTTTPQLAEKVTNHITQIIPNKILPCMSHSYQNFAAMVDPTIPHKHLKTEKDFITWCKEHKIKPEDYLESSAEDNTAFYKKLYQEFRILAAYPKLEDYQTLGVLESLFTNDKALQKSIFELYSQYTKDFVDLNFYDLSPAIATYKKQYPHLVPNLFLDEAQNLSRIQFLNLKAYAVHSEKMIISLDPRQSVYDPISNLKFITRCFEANKVSILPIELDHSYRVPLAVSTLLQQLDNLEKEHTGGRTESKNNTEIYATNTDKPGELVVIYDASPDKEKLLEECKQLCKRPNCLVIVGDPTLLTEAKTALADSEKDTTLFFTSDKSIGLEFDHVILYKPWAAFSEAELQSLMASVEKMSISKGNINKPKDKHDKTKHAPLPKLHQLLVAASRPLKSLHIIPGVELKPVLTENQPKTRAQKKQAKEKISTLAGLTEYLLKTSTLTSTPCVTDKKQILSTEQIYKEWIDTCWKLIVNEKDYDEAQRICEQKGIKPEELNLLEGLRTQIPSKFHAIFFKPLIKTQQSDKKPKEPLKQTSTPTEDYIKDFLENLSTKKAHHLFSKEYKALESILFDPNKEGNNLWDMLVKEKKLWTVMQAIECDVPATQKLSRMLNKYPHARVNVLTLMLMNGVSKENLFCVLSCHAEMIKTILFERPLENGLTLFQAFTKKDKELLISCLKINDNGFDKFIIACENSELTKKMASDFMYQFSLSFKTKKMDLGEQHIPCLTLACTWGSTAATMTLGRYYQLGHYIKKDPAVAYRYFVMASKEGDKEALLQLADCHDKGEGIEQNHLIATKLRSLAKLEPKIAAQQISKIFPKLGPALSQVPNVMPEAKTDQREPEKLPQKQKTSKEKYIEIFVKGFSKTDVSVLFARDLKKIESIVFKPNEQGQTLLTLLKQAEKLSSFLQMVYDNANFYEKWHAIIKKYPDSQSIVYAVPLPNFSEEAMRTLFLEPSEQLCTMLFESHKTVNKVFWELLSDAEKHKFTDILSDEDKPQYLKAFIACTAHSSKAKQLGAEYLYSIGYCYLNEKNNISKARDFYHLAMNMGHALSCGLLGSLYDKDKNLTLAIQCYELGNTRGDAGSQYCLGVHYRQGEGLKKNRPLAIEFFESASAQGQKDALKTLAMCYEIGEGVPLNAKTAELLSSFSTLNPSKAKKSFTQFYFPQKAKLEAIQYTPEQKFILKFLNAYSDIDKASAWIKDLFSYPLEKISILVLEIKVDNRNFWTILLEIKYLWFFITEVNKNPGYKEKLFEIIKNSSSCNFTLRAIMLLHNFKKENICIAFSQPQYLTALLFESVIAKDTVLWEKLSKDDRVLLLSLLTSEEYPDYLDKFIIAMSVPKAEKLSFHFLVQIAMFYLPNCQTNTQDMKRVDQLCKILISIKIKFKEEISIQNFPSDFILSSRQGSSAAIQALGRCFDLGLGVKQNSNIARSLFALYELKLKPFEAAHQFNAIDLQISTLQFSSDTPLQQTNMTEETKNVLKVNKNPKSKTG